MPLNFGALGFGDLENKMFQDAELAVDKNDLWEWLSANTTIGPDNYSTTLCKEIDLIGHTMKYKHTPESFNRTMHEMHHLARLGIDAYCSSYTMAIAAPSAPKPVIQRTPDMDKKVIEEILARAPFKAAPKWSREYVTTYPDVLKNLPTARKLNF